MRYSVIDITIVKGLFGWFVMVDDEPVRGPFYTRQGAERWARRASAADMTINKQGAA